VCCNGKDGKYVIEEHRVVCTCEDQCAQREGGRQLFTLTRFESHADCKGKKWKQSVRLPGCTTTLLQRVR